MNTVGYDLANVLEKDLKETVDKIKCLNKSQVIDRDQAFLEITEALFNGKAIIDMDKTILNGGLNSINLMPNLALGLAIDRFVHCFVYRSRIAFYRKESKTDEIYSVPIGPLREDWNKSGKTTVPYIPPQIRPEQGVDSLFVLFETKQWDIVPTVVDPILCRQVYGNVFVVEAVWDMTQLEAIATGL